jgi:hypothetical protein
MKPRATKRKLRKRKITRKRGGLIKKDDVRSYSPISVRRREDAPQIQDAQPQEQAAPIAREYWNFKVKCNNQEEYTSPHDYTRIGAMRAARAYCEGRGGVNGRPEYGRDSRIV